MREDKLKTHDGVDILIVKNIVSIELKNAKI